MDSAALVDQANLGYPTPVKDNQPMLLAELFQPLGTVPANYKYTEPYLGKRGTFWIMRTSDRRRE